MSSIDPVIPPLAATESVATYIVVRLNQVRLVSIVFRSEHTLLHYFLHETNANFSLEQNNGFIMMNRSASFSNFKGISAIIQSVRVGRTFAKNKSLFFLREII